MKELHYGFTIPSDHPSLIDHFPGNPLVPGALILDHVLLGCELLISVSLQSIALKEIKFKSPLRALESAHVAYTNCPIGLRFRVWVSNREVASGILHLQTPISI